MADFALIHAIKYRAADARTMLARTLRYYRNQGRRDLVEHTLRWVKEYGGAPKKGERPHSPRRIAEAA